MENDEVALFVPSRYHLEKNRRNKKMKKLILSGILSLLVISGLLVAAESSAFFANESADGEGTLVNEDGTQSQFSFNVKRNPNGKVTGQATIRNPSYKQGNGQTDKIKIDVSCLKVVGNIAVIGGMTKRKSNQASDESVYFAVEDNSDAGGGADKIFRGFYFDDDASTKGDPAICQTLESSVLVLEPIVEGAFLRKLQAKGEMSNELKSAAVPS